MLKNNLLQKPAPLGMRISDDGLHFTPTPPAAPHQQSALEEAQAFVLAQLGERSRWQTEVEEAAKQEGISLITLRRAKATLGVQAKRDGASGRWYWFVPRKSVE